MPEPFTVLVMAAGHGTRMHSELPKVLHPVCGKPMVEWVIDAAREAGATRSCGRHAPGEGVAERPARGRDASPSSARARAPAPRCSPPATRSGDSGTVVVLSGDHPLLVRGAHRPAGGRAHAATDAAATCSPRKSLDPAGYGRIVRAADGAVERIVETKRPVGVADEELAIREINIGTYAFEPPTCSPRWSGWATEDGELYLTGRVPRPARPTAAWSPHEHRRHAQRHGRERRAPT